MNNNIDEKKGTKALEKITKMPSRIKLLILIILVFAFAVSFPFICGFAGRNFGRVVGTAVGSFQAVTVDMPEAYSQGKEDGLNAEDIRTDIQTKVREVAKLDVLAANAVISDAHRVGEKYAALYTFGADVIFSVDLSVAVVYQADDHLIIRLPKPVGQINIDSTKTRLEESWQKFLFDGSTKDGITAYINSVKQIQEDAENTLEDYDRLQQSAEDSAVKQIKMLAGAIAGDESTVEIVFEQEVRRNNE